MKLNGPKILAIAAPFITLLAGYFGYQPVQELRSSPSVNIEVITPDHSEHNEHVHKNWLPVIKGELEKAIAEQNDKHH